MDRRSVPLVPRRRSLRRRILWVLAALLVVAVSTWAFVVRPREPAIAFLNRLAGPAPTWDDLARAGARLPAEPRPPTVVRPAGRDGAPRVVAVAGVTPEGVRDPRVLRVVEALAAAGCDVVAPELAGLARPGEDETLVDDVVVAWRRALAGDGGASGPRRRVAFLGVSLGAGVVVRALARGAEGDPAPGTVGAVLLVGPPDDTVALARAWFRRPVAAADATGLDEARSDAGLFARHGVARAAAARLLPAAELAPVRAWLDAVGETPSPGHREPAGLASPEAARFVAAVRAEERVADADLAWLLAAATPFLEASSPAAAPSLARVTAPVFVVHGVEDALVPVTEARALAARLTASSAVEVLESRLLSHVDVASPGLAETWRHVTFVQRFLDAAGAP